jgi:hypothetical protein
MNKKQPGPAVIVAMVAGIIVAGFFIFSQLMGGSGPEPVKNLPPAPAGTSSTATTANATPGGQPAATTTVASQPTGAEAAVEAPSPLQASGEAFLAPRANPFVSIAKPVQNTAGALPAPPSGPSIAANSTGTSGLVARSTNQNLPGLGPGGVAPAGVMVPRSIAAEPELAGTLLGQRPSAVFRNDKRLVVVPVGGSFRGWKVVAVEHGAARVKADGRTVDLGVGGVQSRMAIRGNEDRTQSLSSQPGGSLVRDASDVPAARTVTAFAGSQSTGEPVQVVSEPNSITRELTGATSAPATGTTANPAGQNPPAGEGAPAIPASQPPVDVPATLPPAGEKNVPVPPADPAPGTEKVIDQTKDRVRDPAVKP